MMPGDAQERRGAHVVARHGDAVLPAGDAAAGGEERARARWYCRAAQYVIPSVIAMKPRNISERRATSAALPAWRRQRSPRHLDRSAPAART